MSSTRISQSDATLEGVVLVNVPVLAILFELPDLFANNALVQLFVINDDGISVSVLAKLFGSHIGCVVLITLHEDSVISHQFLLSPHNSALEIVQSLNIQYNSLTLLVLQFLEHQF